MKYYVIAVGKKTGIFTSWDECLKYVNGYSGSVYKSFAVKSDAENWLKERTKDDSSQKSINVKKEEESEVEEESELKGENIEEKNIEEENIKAKNTNYKIDKNYFECLNNIFKKLKEKNVILSKNEYIQILDILNENIEGKPKINRSKILYVYTDGSHFKNGGSGRKGFGAYFTRFCEPSKISESLSSEEGFIPKNVSIEIDQKFMEKEFGVSELEISNPTMEIAACCYALKVISENLNKLDDIKEIILYADYEGVQKWLNRTWKITKPYIQKIVDLIRLYEKKITSFEIEVKYIWMKGHSGNYGNDMADKLAKGLIKE